MKTLRTLTLKLLCMLTEVIYQETDEKNYLMISFPQLKDEAESYWRAIHREFAFGKVKDDLR